MRTTGWIVVAAVVGCNNGVVSFAPDAEGTGGAPSTAVTSATTTGGLAGAGGAPEIPVPGPRVLLFTKTTGFRHDSISAAVQGLGQLGVARGWTVTHTEDASTFTDQGLAAFDVIMFLLTTGYALDVPQQDALKTYIRGGGGWVGVHSASDTHHMWPWYGDLVGAYFSSHWSVVESRLIVEDDQHPSTQHLGSEWIRTDEWYSFATNPRGTVSVLMSLDEAYYVQQGAPANVLMGDHPIAWYHEYEGGRAFYTALGHPIEAYSEPAFLEHVAGGVVWAAGQDAPLNP